MNLKHRRKKRFSYRAMNTPVCSTCYCSFRTIAGVVESRMADSKVFSLKQERKPVDLATIAVQFAE